MGAIDLASFHPITDTLMITQRVQLLEKLALAIVEVRLTCRMIITLTVIDRLPAEEHMAEKHCRSRNRDIFSASFDITCDRNV